MMIHHCLITEHLQESTWSSLAGKFGAKISFF